jgi:hypothetical protein
MATDTRHELGVLDSCRPVVAGSRYVHVDEASLDSLAPGLARRIQPPTWHEKYHWRGGTPNQSANWLLVLDALNFSFWGEPRWRVDYHSEKLDGYFALAASLTRAVEEDDRPLWDARYLSELTLDELGQILRGENTIPMLDRRLENLHEVGDVLQSKYDGQFSTAIQMSSRSAVLLARLVARDFLSFDDIADFKGGEVRFLKRAQLLVSDVHGAFGGQGWGLFNDLDQLTAFADYKLPQILRHMGILTYLPSLAEKVDNRFLLPPQSREEVEIRANTLWAVELLRQALARHGASLSAYQLDWWLWNESQSWSGMAPYHLCRTVYY